MLEIEELEVLWDGMSAVALGFPTSEGAHWSTVEIQVWGRDGGRSVLLDLFSVPAGYGHRYLQLPSAFGQLYVVAFEEAGVSRAFTIDLQPETAIAASEGFWNLVLLRAEEAGDGSLLATAPPFPRTGNPDKYIDSHVRLLGRSLLWAAAQIRWHCAPDHLVVSPARLVWPRRQSRLLMEVPPLSRANSEKTRDRKIPTYAVLSHALREGREHSPSRLRLWQLAGSGRANRVHGGEFIFHVMHQRRHFDELAANRSAHGDPSPETLSSRDILQAYAEVGGNPEAVMEWLPAIDDDKARIVGFDLGTAMEAVDNGRIYRGPGAIARHSSADDATEASTIEIEFPTAALGDDVGVLIGVPGSHSIGVAPDDPGGSARARIFRVGKSGLEPRAIADDDPLLDELFRWAVELPGTVRQRAAPPPTDSSATEHQAKAVAELQSRVADPDLVVGMTAPTVFAQPLGPLSAFGYVDMLRASSGEARQLVKRIGGFGTFVRDPALVGAIAAAPHLAPSDAATDMPPLRVGLARRLATLHGVPDVVPEALGPTQELVALRLLRNHAESENLIALRISLAGPANGMERAVVRAADCLRNEVAVRDAADSYRHRRQIDSAQLLEDYLARRAGGGWTPLDETHDLADLVEEVRRYRDQFRQRIKESPRKTEQSLVEATPAEDVDELRRLVRELLARAREIRPAPPALANYDNYPLDELDSALLAGMRDHLQQMLGAPEDEAVFEAILGRIEQWAAVPRFAQSLVERRRGRAVRARARPAVDAFVNRVFRTVPDQESGPFAVEARALRAAVHNQLATHGPITGERRKIEDDLSQYGYILLFHNARRAIDQLVAKAPEDAAAAAVACQLRRRMSVWPRDATQTWNEALDFAATIVPQGRQDLVAHIQPPDLQLSSSGDAVEEVR